MSKFKLYSIIKLTAAGLFIIALAINIKVTLDDPFVMLSDNAIAQTTSSSSSTSSTSSSSSSSSSDDKAKTKRPSSGSGSETEIRSGKSCTRTFTFEKVECEGTGNVSCILSSLTKYSMWDCK